MHGRPVTRIRLRFWLAAAGLALLAAPSGASAAVYTVISQADSREPCQGLQCPSIRTAIDAASGGDTIRIPTGRYQLTVAQLTVFRDVTITGAGAGATTIVGYGEQGLRVFQIGDSQTHPSVEISHLTMTGGASYCGAGGNLVNYGNLRLHHVRATGGQGSSGGGLANASGSLLVEQSLVDGNRATGCEGGGAGGGIYSEADHADALVVRDSTVASNLAAYGGGIAVYDAGQYQGTLGTRLERVTLARNGSYYAEGGGVYVAFGSRLRATGVLLAENSALTGAAHRSTPEPSNCGATKPEDGGGNLADTDDCRFATLPADPRLSAKTVGGLGETDVLTIPPDSPAVDLAGGCQGTDQRDLLRPQGGACDAGAYEVAVPTIDTGPAGPTSDATPTFAFSSEEPGATFECRLDSPGGTGPWEPCTSPKTYSRLPGGVYSFYVRAAGATAQTGRAFTVATPPPALLQPPPVVTPAPTPTPAPTAAQQPEYRKRFVVKATKGTVRVRVPGTRKYVELEGSDGLPMGSSIDARDGRVRLYAARSAGGRTQAASFSSGVFRVVQRGSVVELQLRGPKPSCASGPAAASAVGKQSKAKKARKRRLWGSGRGKFRTRGLYSAATVRGTKWLVEDSCRSTTTRVKRGVVKVRDFERKRTITLRAGERYVARRR